jgi:hypothetical protein
MLNTSKSSLHRHAPGAGHEPASQSLQLLAAIGHCILRAKVTDVLFMASAAAPVLLLFFGRPGLALMLLCPLLIAACLVSAYFDNGPRNRS